MRQRQPTLGVRPDAGFTMLEVLFTMALAATVTSLAVPSTRDVMDEMRTAAAARYLATRLADARIGAVTRATAVALRFEPDASDYRFTQIADGNDNGVRSLDIALGIDRPLGRSERLADQFPGVTVGLMDGCPDAEGTSGTGSDGMRIGAARIATMSANGTATAGTIYLHGRRSQFAVRILGTTGRVRVLQYRPAEAMWVAR